MLLASIRSHALYFFFCSVLLFPHAAWAQMGPHSALLDSTLARARVVSIYTQEIPWDSLREAMHKSAGAATSQEDLAAGLTTLLNGMRDHHASLLSAQNFAPIARFNDWGNMRITGDNRTRELKVHQYINSPECVFEYVLLEKGIGYLKIAGIASQADVKAEGEKIRAALKELKAKKVKKWIIDLRFNSGGNVYPMISGLAPLIGEGPVGGYVDAAGTSTTVFEIKNSHFIAGGWQADSLPPLRGFTKPDCVAVLSSRFTVSSGEFTMAAFKGRKNTRFFGEASGCFTTATSWDFIQNTLILSVAAGDLVDRSGNKYPVNIPVNEETGFENTRDKAADKTLQAAVKWLR